MRERADRAQPGRAGRDALSPLGEEGEKDREAAAAKQECESAVPDSALTGPASGRCRCRGARGNNGVALAPCRSMSSERESE